MKKFTALTLLIGTVIGAGILGIPYVISKSGFPIGALEIILVGMIITITTLYLGEVALRTKANPHLPGYAEKYLGESGKFWMMIALSFGLFSAMIAYMVAEGASLSYLIFNSQAYSIQMSIAFWIFLSMITYFGIRALEEGEIVGVLLIFTMIISISVYFSNKISLSNLNYVFSSNLFAPIGVILFAFLGFSIIPEMKQVLGENRKSMKKIIILAYIIITLIYLIFTAVVIGYKGDLIPEIATIGLGKPFTFLGILTMFTAYLALSTAMIDTIKKDFNKSRRTAWIITMIIPLFIYIILAITKIAIFTKILGIGGIVSGGLTAILIIKIIEKAKVKSDLSPAYSIPYSKEIGWGIIGLFILVAILELKNLIG